MYVKKFEADTLEEALKNVKLELGPDAIILKTVTNKGIRGAFKKSKIEITAAISEKNYVKKAKVDKVFTPDQKEKFYSSNASVVANMIDGYNGETKEMNMGSDSKKWNSYGAAGLNRQVSTVKNISNKVKNSLDDFLSLGTTEEEDSVEHETPIKKTGPVKKHKEVREEAVEVKKTEPVSSKKNDEMTSPMGIERIQELERQLNALNKKIDRFERKDPVGVFQLRTILRGLDISEKYVQDLIKRIPFDLSDEQMENTDIVFEYALQEMAKRIKTQMPLFSQIEVKNIPVITVSISETSVGQTSMLCKLGALKKDSVLVRVLKLNEEQPSNFVEKVFGMDVVYVKTIPEIVAACRKASEENRSVFVDYRNRSDEINETKKFVDGLRRAFEKVEVLICLSAIHSELYNRKIIGQYKNLADGIMISHLDLCLNFGALFNLGEVSGELPLKFYGTGEIVPDDVEAATAERMLAGIFQL